MYSTVECVLKKLKKADAKTGIVSNEVQIQDRGYIKRDKLLQYFDVIVGGKMLRPINRIRKGF